MDVLNTFCQNSVDSFCQNFGLCDQVVKLLALPARVFGGNNSRYITHSSAQNNAVVVKRELLAS